MKPSRVAAMTGLLTMAAAVWADAGPAQDRLRRSLDGPVTQEAVTRSLAVVPDDAGDPRRAVGGEPDAADRVRVRLGGADRAGDADLDGVAAALNDPQLVAAQVTLEGHTDATGPDGYNLRLSQRRAEAVVTYLVRRGVAAPRLRAAGFGETRLLPAFAPADDRQRRVEIVRTF